MKIEEALRQAAALRNVCRSDPGLWNLLKAEEEWALYGDACDPLSPNAPEHALKILQRNIYMDLWSSPLQSIPAGARVMVAGGGTGRFAAALQPRGFQIELVDASPEAVRRAHVHLGSSAATKVGDIASPETLPGDTYDLVLAVEVPCYASDPSRIMRQLATALRRGGTLLFSVEARPGALLADRDLSSPDSALALLDDGVVTLPGLKHVHYYSRSEAKALAEAAGLAVSEVEGVCYLPDGPLHKLIDASRLDDPAHIEQIREIERRCRAHPALRELPRAWAVVAAKP